MEEDIKNRIIAGAEELFMRYGVRSVSMDDVARHLSVSKKTLYQYFADKDEIVTMVASRWIEKDCLQFGQLRSGAKNAIDELMRISRHVRQELQKINPTLLFDLHKFHPKAWNLWMEHKQSYVRKSIINNLVQGMEEGYFRPDLNPEVLAIARMEMVQMMFDDRVFPTDRYPLAEVNTQLYDHFVIGLLTDKGRKAYEKYKLQTTELSPLP